MNWKIVLGHAFRLCNILCRLMTWFLFEYTYHKIFVGFGLKEIYFRWFLRLPNIFYNSYTAHQSYLYFIMITESYKVTTYWIQCCFKFFFADGNICVSILVEILVLWSISLIPLILNDSFYLNRRCFKARKVFSYICDVYEEYIIFYYL